MLIAGRSGSGKSTLAHCINGLIPFSYEGNSTGNVLIAGKDPRKEVFLNKVNR
ncbi:ATP-binding cassette domain-containing protein [Bacillus cereus]